MDSSTPVNKMNVIEIKVGNHYHKISCKDGEEAHIKNLSDKLSQRVDSLAKSFGDKASENLLLIIAGIMLEDELANKKPTNSANNNIAKSTNHQESQDLKLAAKESIASIDKIMHKLNKIQNPQ